MKKIVAFLLALSMVLAMAACGSQAPAATTEAPKTDAPAGETTAAPAETEAPENLTETQKIIKDITGKEPKGFRTPSGDWHVRTPYLLNELGFLYSSSMRGDDIPYYTVLDGKETDLVEIPSKWELDDYVAQAYSVYPAEPAGLDRISCYRNVQDNDLREFRGYYDMGLCIAFLMHPQISGAPGRNLVLEEVLKEVTSHKDVWVATGSEVAEYWRKAHPRKED